MIAAYLTLFYNTVICRWFYMILRWHTVLHFAYTLNTVQQKLSSRDGNQIFLNLNELFAPYATSTSVAWHDANRISPKATWVPSRVTIVRCEPLFATCIIHDVSILIKKILITALFWSSKKWRDISSRLTVYRCEPNIIVFCLSILRVVGF